MNSDPDLKKASLEDLPKDKLIEKCKGLLSVLQKAKQIKETLTEENNNLKEKFKKTESDIEMLESLVQQKVQLLTSLEEIKSQKKVLENKLNSCEYNLGIATEKINNLDNENQGCRRQIERLVEENEQLLSRLDGLAPETEELKDTGSSEQQQPLVFEKHNISKELAQYPTLKTKVEQLEISYNQVKNLNQEVEVQNQELLEKYAKLTQNIVCIKESNNVGSEKTTEVNLTDNDRLKNTSFNLNMELDQEVVLIELQVMDNCLCHVINTTEKLKDALNLLKSDMDLCSSELKLIKQEHENDENCNAAMHQTEIWRNEVEKFYEITIIQLGEFDSYKYHFTREYHLLKIKSDAIEKENAVLNSQNKKLLDTIEILNSNVTDDQADNKISTQSDIKQAEEYKTESESTTGEENLLKEQYQRLMIEYELLQKQQQKERNDIEEENRQLQEKNGVLLHNLQQQAVELETRSTCNENLMKSIDDYQDSVTKMEDQVTKLSEDNKSISEELGDMQAILFQRENESASQQQQLTLVKNENNELLAEMNEMNQVLKERGETISKQQEYCEELLKNIKLRETQSKKYLEVITEKECAIKKLEENYDALKNSALNQVVPIDNSIKDAVTCKDNEQIALLQNEITALKEKLLHVQDTSQETCYAESETLSTSTISRAEDMNRIKDLEGSWEEKYGKLRSLALKLKGKLREISEQLAKEQYEKNELQQKLTITHKTIQTLQSQCDLLHDELDNNKSELKDYGKQLDLAASNKSTHLKNLADNEEIISKLKSEIEELNKQKASTDLWKKQVSGKVQNLKRELDANLVVRKELEDQIKKLNMDLDEKSKLLNDEIEKHNSTRNSLLESHNECKKQSVLNLEIQDYELTLKEFTQKLDKKQDSIIKLKNQVDQQKNTISSLKEQNRLFEERIQSEEKDLNCARGELQTYKKRVTDLEAIMIEKDEKFLNVTHALENSRAENEELSTHMSRVVTDNQKMCDTLKSDKQLLYSQNCGLEMKVREMNDNMKLKEEGLQEILKEYESYKVRAQSVLRSSQVRNVGLEEKLTEDVASLHAQVEILTSDIAKLQTSVDNLKDENCNLILEKEHLNSKWKEIESALDEQKQMYDILSTKHQKTILENSETISSLKVHADTLSQCYRQQLSDQEARHNKEIIELQSKIEKVMPILDSPTLIPPTALREQGEGSDSVEIQSNPKAHRPLPLEKLLNNEMEDGFLKKQITEHETKVNYLTSLLADTEQDLVKHVQMNKLLKEEIRRYQRSVEREKHAENLEYLKNIVYKFATLNNGDERSRLVPVLNTILKFSPDETYQLNLVAKGEVPGRAWADYLPIWSSGKPQ